MIIRRSLSYGLCVVFGIFYFGLAVAAAALRPNIVIVIADDLGYGDTSTYGGKIATPNLQGMADAGTRFTSFYATPSCSPTRASLMTGLYSQRLGIDYPLTLKDKIGIPTARVSLGELLQSAGYRTALIGKWHLGEPREFWPNRNGFHFFYGHHWGQADHLTHKRYDGTIDWWKNTTLLPMSENTALSVTREAIAFIERNKSGRFFLVVSYLEPHYPYQAPGDPAGFSNPIRYPAMVTAVDNGLGQIIERLKKLGLNDKTLIIFFSDNGGVIAKGAAPIASNDPLRGAKGYVWEGGIRVPAVFKWPGNIPHRVSNDILDVKDIFPTIAAIAGAKLPQYKLDGANVLSALKGQGSAPERKLFFEYGKSQAVRDGEWKLVIEDNIVRLFNIERDIGEKIDVSAANPAKVAELKAAKDAWKNNMSRP